MRVNELTRKRLWNESELVRSYVIDIANQIHEIRGLIQNDMEISPEQVGSMARRAGNMVSSLKEASQDVKNLANDISSSFHDPSK